jgi:hypothetical protein
MLNYLHGQKATVVFRQILFGLEHHEAALTSQHTGVFGGDVSLQGLLI